jgi:branched-chain amino acid transport system ATP-binding protein
VTAANGAPAGVAIRGLVAGYAKTPAVHGLDLTVARGEVVALLGPNGAGKTTTLLTTAGVLPVMEGEIEVLGQKVRRAHKMARLGLALVPEDRGLFFQLTVAENLRLHRRRRSSIAAPQIYEWFPALAGLGSRRAGLLSGGEQQMLALGCALMAEPKVLMVDEMSHGLAPIVVDQLLPILRRLADETGIAVLLVEQHIKAALEIADRVYVLNRGRLVLEGRAEDVRDKPEVLEASYLGERDGGGAAREDVDR